MDIPNLDDLEVYRKYDPSGMLGNVRGLPLQCEQAWRLAMDFKLPEEYRSVDRVVILGMGGSAIGGSLAAGLVGGEARVPVIIHGDYHLPAFVDGMTLVIASSYSGETEEVLSSFKEALKTGARLLAVTTGGKLKALAEENGIPVFSFTYKAQPRAALGFSLLPILCFLQKLRFLKDKSADVAEMVQTLTEMSAWLAETVPAERNPAKRMAQRLHGRLPVVYGSGLSATVARRWKTQFNENSKAWAFFEVLPELNHNAVLGYQFPKEVAAVIRVVLLRTPSLEPRLRLRQELTAELLGRAGIGCEFVDGQGSSELAQMMSLVMFGDFVSCYLAILCQVDPTPVDVIAWLKSRLSGN